jgi:predicted small metal-binding protein
LGPSSFSVKLAQVTIQEEIMMEFHCNKLVPGCSFHTQAETQAELIARVTRHLRSVHGEADIKPQLVEAIKARSREVESA